MKIYEPDEVLSFGKNKGFKLEEIYKYEPNYLEYLIINSFEFAINIESFEKLPKPTPLAIGAVTGSEDREKIWKGNFSLLEKYHLSDNVNIHLNVEEIKELVENSKIKKELKFEFSEETKKINKLKISNNT
jgi:hypothetical protein